MAIARFNSSFCFSKTFSRERSSPPPPNFAPPFCAFCLIVCDFLPKTWNLGRKEGKSALSGAPEGTPPVAYGDSPLGDGAFGIAAQFQAEAQSCLPGSTPSVIACGDATFPKGTAFGGGGKACSIAQRRPLGGAGTAQAVTEGVSAHPSRENAKSGSPQAARLCSNYQ